MGTCEIENTLAALEEKIRTRKEQISNAQVSRGPSSVISQLISAVFNKAGGSYAQVANVLEHSRDHVRDFIKMAQENVQERPWEVLRIVAVYSFGMGLFLSLRSKGPSKGGKE